MTNSAQRGRVGEKNVNLSKRVGKDVVFLGTADLGPNKAYMDTISK